MHLQQDLDTLQRLRKKGCQYHHNHDKTETFAIGGHHLDQANYPHKVRNLLKFWELFSIITCHQG